MFDPVYEVDLAGFAFLAACLLASGLAPVSGPGGPFGGSPFFARSACSVFPAVGLGISAIGPTAH